MYQLYFFMLSVILALASASATPTPTPITHRYGCPDKCGNLSIPYPFGTKEGCYLSKEFLITCDETSSQAFLGKTHRQVLNISVEGQLHIIAPAAYDDTSGNRTNYSSAGLSLNKFPISYSQNKVIVIGCYSNGIIQGLRAKGFATGCISYCDQLLDATNGSCAGIGCCQSSIPKEVLEFGVDLDSFFGHQLVWSFNPCSYAFVADTNSYNFSILDFADLRNVMKMMFPVVLDWGAGNETCNDARKVHETYACKDYNSICYDSDSGPGYRCSCSDGYQGNPYLPNGCTNALFLKSD